MRIQHNIAAMNSYRNYTSNTKSVSKNLEKLSSGYKINRAGDDAAGLAISEKMRAQITGLKTASKNAKDGISLVQTAEGALTEVHSMLNRMVELTDQSANGTYDNAVDRSNLKKEFTALSTEIDRIADSSNFNGIKLLDGSLAGISSSGSTNAASLVDVKATVDVAAHKALSTAELTSYKGDGDAAADAAELATSVFEVNGKKFMFADKDIVTADKTAVEAMGITVVVNAAAGKTAPAQADVAKMVTAINGAKTGATAEAGVVADGVFTAGTAATDLHINLMADHNAAAGGGLALQIGETSESFNKLNVNITDVHVKALGISDVNIGTQVDAAKGMEKLKAAINSVSATRGDLGANQNRLDHTINNLNVMTENIQEAESSIRDVDVADEMMAYTKNNILVQSAQAMLAQANQLPQGVLQLLQ